MDENEKNFFPPTLPSFHFWSLHPKSMKSIGKDQVKSAKVFSSIECRDSRDVSFVLSSSEGMKCSDRSNRF
ncbi:hypothetical protein TNCV_2286491 [Trichonephila clavipes]|nr:hypothetical protein TNCV_2286491 [Trichonephila clavipes]